MALNDTGRCACKVVANVIDTNSRHHFMGQDDKGNDVETVASSRPTSRMVLPASTSMLYGMRTLTRSLTGCE